jgi:hypothetical protein
MSRLGRVIDILRGTGEPRAFLTPGGFKPGYELKNCPFCGKQSRQPEVQEQWTRLDQWSGLVYFVACPVCDALGPRSLYAGDAVRSWNLRFTS